MARVKSKSSKIKNKVEATTSDEVIGEVEPVSAEPFPTKKKGAVVVLDEHVEIEVPEEKVEEEIAIKPAEEEEELLVEEVGLDDEELNPFGDKWEE